MGDIRINIGSQRGCGMQCPRCDLNGPGKNIGLEGFIEQIDRFICNFDVGSGDCLKGTFGCPGEPSWNLSIILSSLHLFAKYRRLGILFAPSISTMMPKSNRKLESFLKYWM